MARAMTFFLQNMWMATQDNGLAWIAYGPCSVNALAGNGVRVKLKGETAYPFEETIKLSVDPEKAATFPLKLRVPGWCSGFAVEVNGEKVVAAADTMSFVTVRREWKAGDKVTLRLPMTPRAQVAREREGAPFGVVHYGPLTFALPVESSEMQLDAKADWQFVLDAPEGAEKQWKVERVPMPAKWTWPLASPLSISVSAVKTAWTPVVRKAQDLAAEMKLQKENIVATYQSNDITTLPGKPFPNGETKSIRLIPYGCTRYRVTMFPITERTAPRIEVPNPAPAPAPLFVKESTLGKE